MRPIANGDAWFARRGEIGERARQAGLRGYARPHCVLFDVIQAYPQQRGRIGAAVAQEEGHAGVYTCLMAHRRNPEKAIDVLAAAQSLGTAQILPINSIGDSFVIDDESARFQALRAALPEALRTASKPRIQATKQRREAVLMAIAEGCSIAEAARSVGLTPAQIHHLRRTDEGFGTACEIAIQCAQDAVTARLHGIALHGRGDSMATVRAAEQYLRATGHPSFQPPKAPRVTMTRVGPDGAKAILTVGTDGVAS